ncbi:hypothetical protein KA082_02340 [Candidatus Woesebacteria bacterium]|nr:hypothetical protein [Candidatus Woesebacteria bacterium]
MPVTERVSSRLVKKEQKKMLRQTVWFVVIGLLLVVGFLFLILPNFIRIINSVLNTKPITEEETVLIQAPVLSAPVSATFSAKLAISGYGAANLKTIILLNGERGPEVQTNTDGTFSTEITLASGENTISAFTKDEKNHESTTARPYTVVLDTLPPKIELKEPENKKVFDSKQKLITVAGLAEPLAKLYLNGRYFTPRSDGSFSTTLSLNTGENKITLIAVDQAGNESKIERVVTLNP